MKKLSVVLAAVWMLAAQQSFAAKIYTCVVNGETVYTSKPSGNCRSADLPPIGRYSSARYDAPQPAVAQPPRAAAQSQSSAPARSGGTSRNSVRPQAAAPAAVATPPRNANTGSGRRTILEQELANERKALAADQQALASARAAKNGAVNQQLVSQLQGSVLDRQQNIQALQRELGRM
ncbi:MAG: hypothetical protein Q4G28_04320 [Neisseria sp.]|nr:hypothetical protein [Neisseria sp.]